MSAQDPSSDAPVAGQVGWPSFRRPRVQQLQLWTGLILFSFVLSHFANHALGLVSVEAMESFGGIRSGLWRSLPGTVLLYGALLTHIVIALWKTAKRRTWRMPIAEAAQLFLGLTIPIMLLDHLIGTRALYEVFGIEDAYRNVLSLQWPGLAVWQSTLLVVVWTHAMIGLHFWLRMRSWYPKAAPFLLALAVLIPALALAGWIEAARRIVIAGETERTLTRESILWADPVIRWTRWGLIALIAATVLTSLAMSFGVFDRARVRVTYPHGRMVRARPGQTLLEVSRENGIPHTSVCGGRARCSTCRTRIKGGHEHLPPPERAEKAVLARISASQDVRLACQLRVKGDVSVQPLFPAATRRAGSTEDGYRWGIEQSIAILFIDIRGFTALSERRLPFDVVFILNEYLNTMSSMVTRNGGIVDKFIGDSVMALFGITSGPQAGCREALKAAAAMMEALPDLNERLREELSGELRVGIGIHAGPAILGHVGVGAASGGITALGDTVNTASRLEGATKEFGTTLVVSDEVARYADIDVSSWRVERIMVRGRTTPLTVHPIAGPGPLRDALAAAERLKPAA